MEQWKERLLEEFKQLDIRVEKLIKFLDANREDEEYSYYDDNINDVFFEKL